MPRMTGPELLTAIRSSSTELALVPFILVSAKTSDNDKVSALLVSSQFFPRLSSQVPPLTESSCQMGAEGEPR